MLPPVPGTEARWRPGSADPTAPEVSQAPGLRELRLAESSRPYRRPETESQQVTEVTGSHPVTGTANRQEDEDKGGGTITKRVVSGMANLYTHRDIQRAVSREIQFGKLPQGPWS